MATKISATIGALALSAGAASAADLPLKAPPLVAPIFDWTGFYTGGHAGCSNGCSHDDPVLPFPPTTSTGNQDLFASLTVGNVNLSGSSLKGFIGGVHAGYNYQLPNRFVVGFEGDVDYTDMQANASGLNPVTVLAGQAVFRTTWQGSLRGRVGYAFDRLLVFGTGGLAIADGKLSALGTLNGVPLPNTSSSNTHVGWTAGGGLEYAFTQQWLGRVEARYTDFQSETYAGPIRPISVKWDQVSVSLGVSYKF